MADDSMDDIKKMMRKQKPAGKPEAEAGDKQAKSGPKLTKGFAEPVRKKSSAFEDDEPTSAVKKAAAQAQKPASVILAEHVVAAGDTLSGISAKHYGTQNKWKAIYELNKDVIGDNPSLIRVGQKLRIPKLD